MPLPDDPHCITTEDIASNRPDHAIVPIGAYEQHGPHLPMTTDTLIADAIARAVGRQTGGIVLPALPVSCSAEHAGFAGSLWLRSTTLAAIIDDLLVAVQGHGIQRLILVNAHGGNHVLAGVVQEANAAAPRVILGPDRHDWQAAFAAGGLGDLTVSQDMHAGAAETAILQAIAPQTVRSDRIVDHRADDRPLLHILGMRAYTDTGVIGEPSRATAVAGHVLLKTLADRLAARVRAWLDRPVATV